MLKVHKLSQPNKHSGSPLLPGKAIELRGIIVKNNNEFTVYVDTFTRKPWKPDKSSKKATTKTKKEAAKKLPLSKKKHGAKSDAVSL